MQAFYLLTESQYWVLMVVSACVSDETQKTPEELCEKTGKKMSILVRTLIEDSLELELRLLRHNK